MTDALDETLEDARRKRDDLAPGALVGKYRLERVLGSGGMGVVWAAHDPDLERTIALKLLRGAAADADPHARQRLLREARAMAKLAHPNVIVVYEVGTAGDRDFIAMELVDGSSLDVWLADKPARKDAWQAVLAAGRGLAAAHAAGLVHRDFKPHNVLRARDGRIVVTDFGLAREEARGRLGLIDRH
jgi:eukaryotic-like serine/threonine-protein kinase